MTRFCVAHSILPMLLTSIVLHFPTTTPRRADTTNLACSFKPVEMIFHPIFGNIGQTLGDFPATGRGVLHKDRQNLLGNFLGSFWGSFWGSTYPDLVWSLHHPYGKLHP